MSQNVSQEHAEERQAVTITNHGQKMFGVIHRPLQKGKRPAVVFCSGFAGTKFGKYRLFVKLSEELARRGILSLRFDYRCTGDSEGDFKDATFKGEVDDTLQILEYLAQDPQVDSSQLALFGRSLGGAVSILAAKRFQNIKSLVLWAPVFCADEWKALWEASKIQKLDPSQMQVLKSLPGQVPNLQFLQEFFNIHIEETLADLKDVPLLHVHGELDSVVKISHADGYKQSRRSSPNTRFIRLAHSDHDFGDPEDQKIAIAETCDWLEKTLLGSKQVVGTQ